MSGPQADVTRLLLDWSNGDRAALESLVPLVYTELRTIASRRLRAERRGQTLQTTALVQEAYLKLVHAPAVPWEGRCHFYAVAARVVRQILVDRARARAALKRNAAVLHPTDIENEIAAPHGAVDVDVLALNDALEEYEALDPAGSRIVEMRFFSGMSNEETAAALGVSRATVERKWYAARLWLFRKLNSRPDGKPAP